MARKTPKSRRQPIPQRAPAGRQGARPDAGGDRVPSATAPADVETSYPHMRRDLVRIAVLAVVMFTLIFASQFVVH